MERIVIGLISANGANGLPELPVDSYIFDKLPDTLNINYITQGISVFLANKVGVYYGAGIGLNQAHPDTITVRKGKRPLTVYMTGTEPASITAELVYRCVERGIDLTLMHFNSETRSYARQHFRARCSS